MTTFTQFRDAVNAKFKKMCKEADQLFVVDIAKDDIYNAYLNSFEDGTNPIFKERTEHDCNCCKQFIRRVGKVVAYIDGQFETVWGNIEAPTPYQVVADRMDAIIKGCDIVNVFLSDMNNVGAKKTLQQLEDGNIKNWEHFYAQIPSKYCNTMTADAIRGKKRTNMETMKRAMTELTLEAGETILELINQGSIYRGSEHKATILNFIKFKKRHAKDSDNVIDNDWYWLNSDDSICHIRNSSIGTLLIDISADENLDVAVRKFESVMAPSNYKRPKAIYTKKMKEEAEKLCVELGLIPSLARRYATINDITVNNVLHMNRSVQAKLEGSLFDELDEDIAINPRHLAKVEEVSIEKFINDILPSAKNIEVMMENRLSSNLVTLVAPDNADSKSMFKWDNNFSWSYNGGIADSDIKANVATAGGKVDGVLRFSIQWNGEDDNNDDLDAWCVEPTHNKIGFGNKRNYQTGGNLDIDITSPRGVAVENITWPDESKMAEGEYHFYVNNYASRGAKSGFKAEIEYNGEVWQFENTTPLRHGQNVTVAKIQYSRRDGVVFKESLDSTITQREVWGVKTNSFVPVSSAMLSPNYWDEQESNGNKHFMFFLDGCVAEDSPRGMYNEFLSNNLLEHKHVFEALGSKMVVKGDGEDQLSGLGFSETKKNDMFVRVEGRVKRIIKIKF